MCIEMYRQCNTTLWLNGGNRGKPKCLPGLGEGEKGSDEEELGEDDENFEQIRYFHFDTKNMRKEIGLANFN